MVSLYVGMASTKKSVPIQTKDDVSVNNGLNVIVCVDPKETASDIENKTPSEDIMEIDAILNELMTLCVLGFK